MKKRILMVCLFLFPVAAWGIYKPMRVLVPELVSGITCKSETICIDDISRYPEALKLYEEALNFVDSSLGNLRKRPRVIFCSTVTCFHSFGFKKASASTIGTSGIVISPRGWKYYYLRHEIIHHLQAERLGVISQWRSPGWYKEGMAYYLSLDPRKKLSDKYQQDRTKFALWYKNGGKEKIWEIPSNL